MTSKSAKSDTRRWLIRAMATTIVTTTLVACGSDNNNTGSANTITYPVNAVGSQEVPATGSSATAAGNLVLDAASGSLTGTITTSGVTASAAHIHDAFAGSNGAIVVALQVSGNDLIVPANTTLTSAQISALQAGQYYVNVHSVAFAGGEIRGQILGSNIRLLQATLDGNQEVPASGSVATGTGFLTVNTDTNTLTANVVVSGANDATAAHIHTGAAGINGGVLLGLTQDATDVTAWSVDAAAVTAGDVTNILAGGTYFNVHTPSNPGGEVRGQILAP